MIEEILRLGDRPIRVAMTPRHEVFWIALDDSDDILRKEIRTCPYSRIVVARENEFTVEEIDLAIHAHPTLSEAIGEAVLDSMGKMLHA
jgi:Mg2+/Co2+ transporter CorB